MTYTNNEYFEILLLFRIPYEDDEYKYLYINYWGSGLVAFAYCLIMIAEYDINLFCHNGLKYKNFNCIFSHVSPFDEQNAYLTKFGILIVIYNTFT
jgi:hypothetical protein